MNRRPETIDDRHPPFRRRAREFPDALSASHAPRSYARSAMAAASSWLKRPLLLSADAGATRPSRTTSARSPRVYWSAANGAVLIRVRPYPPSNASEIRPPKPAPAGARPVDPRSEDPTPREVEPSREEEPAVTTRTSSRTRQPCSRPRLRCRRGCPPRAAGRSRRRRLCRRRGTRTRRHAAEGTSSRLDVREAVAEAGRSRGRASGRRSHLTPQSPTPCSATGAQAQRRGDKLPKVEPLRTGEPGAEADPKPSSRSPSYPWSLASPRSAEPCRRRGSGDWSTARTRVRPRSRARLAPSPQSAFASSTPPRAGRVAGNPRLRRGVEAFFFAVTVGRFARRAAVLRSRAPVVRTEHALGASVSSSSNSSASSVCLLPPTPNPVCRLRSFSLTPSARRTPWPRLAVFDDRSLAPTPPCRAPGSRRRRRP